MGLSIFGLFFLLNNSVTAFVAFKEISAKTSVKLTYVRSLQFYSHPFKIPDNDVYAFVPFGTFIRIYFGLLDGTCSLKDTPM